MLTVENADKSKVIASKYWYRGKATEPPNYLLAYDTKVNVWRYIDVEYYLIHNVIQFSGSGVGDTVRSYTDMMYVVPKLLLPKNRRKYILKLRNTYLCFSHTTKCWRYITIDEEAKTYTYTSDYIPQQYKVVTTKVDKKCNYKYIKNIKGKEVMINDKNYVGKFKLVRVYGVDTFACEVPKDVTGYTVKADPKLVLKEGDLVVVDDNSGLITCRIVSVINPKVEVATQLAKYIREANLWVINKVNTTKHTQRMDRTKELADLEKELTVIKAQAEKRAELEKELQLLKGLEGAEALIKRRQELLDA